MVKRFLLGLLIISTLFPGGFVAAQSQVGQDSLRQAKANLIIRIMDLIQQLILKKQEQTISLPPITSGPKTPIPKPTTPVIFEVIPDRGPVGTQITVKGNGFLPQNNMVYTGYGPIILPSPDGQTLTFTFNPPGVPAELSTNKKADFPELIFGIYVVNENGQTAEPGKFIFVP